jgi:hypothetical protein
MHSWAEDAAFTAEAIGRFPELSACHNARHVVANFRLNLSSGPVRTVGCWKCRTCVFRGRVVTHAEAFWSEWTGPAPTIRLGLSLRA